MSIFENLESFKGGLEDAPIEMEENFTDGENNLARSSDNVEAKKKQIVDLERTTKEVKDSIKVKKGDVVPYVKTSDLKSELMLENLSKMGYDLSSLQDVLRTDGNQLILSCAGSGKTTGLVLKILFESRLGRLTEKVDGRNVLKKVWVSTFLKTGAEELSSETSEWCRKLGLFDFSTGIKFSTIHSEFYQALRTLGQPFDIIDDKMNTNLLKKVLKEYNIRTSKGAFLSSENVSSIMSALSYSRNRLDDSKYQHPTYEEFDMSYLVVDGILKDWAKARADIGKYDFEDFQDILYDKVYVMEDQEYIDFLSNRYDFLYVDEFQDTSQKQYALLKVYAQGAEKIVVVGDDDQTIYTWRGSDNNIITDKFIKDFKPTVSYLDTNYRCPENVLKPVISCIENNPGRLEKTIKAYKEGGELRVGYYSSYTSMANTLINLVKQDRLDKLYVTIQCRENSDALLPAMLLDRDGRYKFSISSKGMTLDGYMPKQAIGILKLLTESTSPIVISVLKQAIYEHWEVNDLVGVLKNSGKNIWTVNIQDLEYSCPNLARVLVEWRKKYDFIKENNKDSKGKATLEMAKYLLEYYMNRVYVKQNIYSEKINSIIFALIVYMSEVPFEDVTDFIYELGELNTRLQSRIRRKGCGISLVTVHEYKGKESQSTYIWNASNGVFPHKRSVTEEEVQEERRLFYIACTRATVRNTILCLAGLPSSFLNEMDLSNVTKLDKSTSESVFDGSLTRQEIIQQRNRDKYLGEDQWS